MSDLWSRNFSNIINFVLKWEGGYDNDPDDPGGETNFGIDKRSHPNVDIKHLTREGAIAIYHESYWLKMHCDELPTKIAAAVMDIGVNNGIGRAARWLQEAVEAKVDGVIGIGTITAARSADDRLIAIELIERREEFYRSIAKGRMAKYLNGWLNRNGDLRRLVDVIG